MSLATRCTSCGTIFRVVQDQLKVSDGWVRCGRCDAVFSAASSLFDLEREAPPEWQPPAAPVVAPESSGPPAESQPTESERRWIESIGGSRTPLIVDAPPPVSAPPTAPPRDLRQDDVPRPNDEIVIGPAMTADLWPTQEAPVAALDWAPTEGAPGFVRQARRDAAWQSRRARSALWAIALLLSIALALQGAQQFSELLAARAPSLRPALVAWCGLTGCSVAAQHRIDDIVVESTALSPAVAPAGGLRLAVSLRNRATHPVATPSIDLTLTDITGKMIARRALAPRDLSVAATAIAANSDLSIQTVLTTGGAHVSGYTVEIFYP